MEKSLICLNTDGVYSIMYNYKEGVIDPKTAIATLKELPEKVIEEIKKGTFTDVQKILSNYL